MKATVLIVPKYVIKKVQDASFLSAKDIVRCLYLLNAHLKTEISSAMSDREHNCLYLKPNIITWIYRCRCCRCCGCGCGSRCSSWSCRCCWSSCRGRCCCWRRGWRSSGSRCFGGDCGWSQRRCFLLSWSGCLCCCCCWNIQHPIFTFLQHTRP